MLEAKPCDICGSAEYDVLYRYPRDLYDHAVYETCSWDGRQSIDLQVVTCRTCGSTYSRPSFCEDALVLVYPPDLVPDNPDLDSLVRRRNKHDQMVATVARFLSRGVVCDIGTRYGVMPAKARKAGFNAFGLEANPRAVEVGRTAGLPVDHAHFGTLGTALAQRGVDRVHAFTLDDVIEHLAHPTRDLGTLARHQQAGDLLILRQMDLDSPGHRRYGRDWYYIQPAAHMYYFDIASITRLLTKVGYALRSIERGSTWASLAAAAAGDTLRHVRRALLRPPRPTRAGGPKPSYLIERRKTSGDLFLVVAQKT